MAALSVAARGAVRAWAYLTLALATNAVTGTACSRRESPEPRAQPDVAPAARAHDSTASAGGAAEAVDPGPTNPQAAASKADGGAATAPGVPRLAPLASPQPFASLEVAGFQPAVVSLPLGATRARPVVVALHGNFDRPEWQCEVWRGVLGDRAFILCPRGIPRRDVPKSADRWEYGSLKAVEGEIDAGISALKARYGPHVDPGPLLFIGFSLGAIYGSPLVQKHPERFPRVVLVEGGQGRWTFANAKAFVKGGGLRLFIACGQAGCLQQAKGLARTMERAGLPTRSGGSPKSGHTYDGEVAEAVARELPWLMEGDPRWEGP